MPDPLLINGDRPLVLFPVRLETRFFGQELRIRVFPDKIHVDTHEPELTADEVEWGKHFHRLLWNAATDEARKDAWRQLAERYGVERAAWVVRQLMPTNPTERPTKPPKFPSPPVRLDTQNNETWTRAPRTTVLPDQWIATAFVQGTGAVTVAGQLIPDILPVGPNPQATVLQGDDRLAIDDGMKWMVDFDEAERLGMGLRLQLPTAAPKIDLLLVFGVKKSLDSAASAARLKELIEAHQYTDGLSLVTQGTPTNNTEDVASGFSTDDPGQDKSFRLILGAPQFQAGDGSDGEELSKALGLPIELLARTDNADAHEQREARDMNRALWPSTWGYYLEQMIGLGLFNGDPSGLFPEDLIDVNVEWARQHFVDHVRAGGPLPTIRVGKQPYGVLPVTALDLWGATSEDGKTASKDAAVVELMRRLQDYWSDESRTAARMGNHSDPDIDFSEVFAMDGLSTDYSIRNIFGLFYTQELFEFLRTPTPDVWHRVQSSQALSALRLIAGLRGVTPRAALTVCDPARSSLNLPLIQASATADFTFNYIDQLLKAPDLDAVLQHASIPVPFSLLYLLLRHSMMVEYANAAARLLGREPHLRAEPEHVRFSQLPMETPLDRIIAAALHTGQPFTQPPDKNVQDFRKNLEALKGLKTHKLSMLMRGTLDLTSHRLDAWVTSFATKRLKNMRQRDPAGVYLGGYGWVENLQPGPPRTEVTAPPNEPGPIFGFPHDPGFVHAPSLDHAATVAVLRSGHLTRFGRTPDPEDDPLAIDLSSERARRAQHLLDGVRSGQPLGALLGYRFERGLHERGLDRFIAAFREQAPMNATRVDENGQAVESVPTNHVVDGLNLLRQINEPNARPRVLQVVGNRAGFPVPPIVNVEIDALADSVDALSDALLAESAYHVVRGNPSRAAATLDALERGEAPPPELEVIRTPRTGSAFTHRVVALLPGTPAAIADWTPTPRSLAEPFLNAWAAKLLGNPVKVRCVVERVTSTTGVVVDTQEFRLKDLKLAPIDVIHAQEASEDSRLSELEQRFLFAARRKVSLTATQTLRLNPVRDPSWSMTDVSWSEFTEVVRTVRNLLSGGRALRAGDINAAAVAHSPTIPDSANLKARADRALASLRQLETKLNTALAGVTPTTLAPLRSAMHTIALFGIPGAIPLSAVGQTEADLKTLVFQARSIDREATERLAKADAATDPSQRLKHLFGNSFVVLSRFRPPNLLEIQRALGASTALQDGDPLAVVTFHQRIARVREGVARLDDALQYAEALNNGDALTLQVAQLPQRDGDRWVGLPATSGTPIPSGRLSLIVHMPEAIDFTQPAIAGLLIDEWVEVVPNSNETTGVVFQYNQPDSVAAQAILVAVHPNPMEQAFWTIPWLQQVLRETVSLVHMRAVTPDLLDETSHYLPAAYFAFNAEGHTVSTDFFKRD
ncbi:MAG: hypothetical protein CV088_09895 [Nitrospira sp. LK70]|nr:hypothetical protein [Nitrospira sp. LK70]